MSNLPQIVTAGGRYNGGSRDVTLSGSQTRKIHWEGGRLYAVTCNGSGNNIQLPYDVRREPTGRDFYVANLSVSGNSLTIRDKDSGTIATVGVGQMAIVLLLSNSTAAGTWRAYVTNMGAQTPRT